MFEILASLVVKIQYYKGDKHVFTEDGIAGSVFAVTGVKPGAFAISVNARHPK